MSYSIIDQILNEDYINIRQSQKASWDTTIKVDKVPVKGYINYAITGKPKLILSWLRNKLQQSKDKPQQANVYRLLIANMKQYQNVNRVMNIKYRLSKLKTAGPQTTFSMNLKK